MELKSTLIAVKDMKTSVAFYKNVLGLDVTADFGANVTLSGNISLQTLTSWCEFIGKSKEDVCFYANAAELYFEHSDFDSFTKQLNCQEIHYVHRVKEHRWGQRVVRFYDPDGHIIEVGEALGSVCNRFLNSGMSMEETAQRMDISIVMAKELSENKD